MNESYEAPALADIGSLHELTLITISKDGATADILSGIPVAGTVIGTGSIVVDPSPGGP